jgi:hypothetical protein
MLTTKFRDNIAKAALFIGVAGLVFSALAVVVLPAAFGRTVILLATPNAPEIVNANRAMWMAGDPVAPIYGTPIGDPMRILFAEEDRVIVPAEDPSLTLYKVDKNKGENPLQAQTMRLLGTITALGSGVLLAAGVLHFAWKRMTVDR